MRILLFPQISMRSYEKRSDVWMLSSDAQITKNLGYIRATPDWSWMVCLPYGSLVHEGMDLPDRLSNVTDFRMDWANNVLEGRFYVPFREIVMAIDAWRPDVIICEVPEHVRAFRLAMKAVGHSCPIITVVVHVDFHPETKHVSESFMLRQVDGALASDLTVFTLEGIRDAWCVEAQKLINADVRGIHTQVWPGLFDHKEVWSHREDGQELADQLHELYGDVPIVFFASRLSDEPRTRFSDMIAASNLLNERIPHVLLVANPNESKPWDWIRGVSTAYRPHIYGERTLSRHDYLETLWAADVVPVLYPLDKIGGIGAAEAGAAHNVVLTAPGEDQYGTPTELDPQQICDSLYRLFNTDDGWLDEAKAGTAEEFVCRQSTRFRLNTEIMQSALMRLT